VRLAALAPPAAGQRPEALAGEAGAALPLRPPLLSSLLGPGCIHLSPSLASSRVRPCPLVRALSSARSTVSRPWRPVSARGAILFAAEAAPCWCGQDACL